jgi:hypothetical protein
MCLFERLALHASAIDQQSSETLVFVSIIFLILEGNLKGYSWNHPFRGTRA